MAGRWLTIAGVAALIALAQFVAVVAQAHPGHAHPTAAHATHRPHDAPINAAPVDDHAATLHGRDATAHRTGLSAADRDEKPGTSVGRDHDRVRHAAILVTADDGESQAPVDSGALHGNLLQPWRGLLRRRAAVESGRADVR